MERFTAAEKCRLVEEYLVVPHGTKGAWLRERALSGHSMSRWRRAFLYGDLERNWVPRDTAGMSVDDGPRVVELQARLAAEREARTREKAALEAEVERLRASNEALGKAIGLLHDRSARQEPQPRQ